MKNFTLLLVAILAVFSTLNYIQNDQKVKSTKPTVNKYLDKDNPPKGIRKAMDHLMKIWTNMGETEYSDELYIQVINEANAMKQNAAHKTQSINPTLEWQELGPNNVGGRTRTILIDKDDDRRVYAGGVTGGVYISENGGDYWRPYAYNEEFGSLSIGRIVQTAGGSFFVSTSEPRHGENAGVIGGFVPGVGIYRIDDWNEPPVHLPATATWKVINHMITHPVNSNQIFACLDSPGGIQVSNDNGLTWNAIAGIPLLTAFDLRFSADFDAYAAVGTDLFKSTDGGASFQEINDPIFIQGGPQRRLVACSPTDNNIVYSVMTISGRLHKVVKSVDAGDTWTEIAPGGTTFLDIFGLNDQGWYDACLAVDPTDPDRIFVGGVTLWTYSDEDGWRQLDDLNNTAMNPYYIHADKHTFTFHPNDSKVLYVGTDGGVFKTLNANAQNPTFYPANFGYTVTQFYSVGASRDGRVMGGTQDNSTPYIDYSGWTPEEAEVLYGGDGTYAEISHINPDLMFLGSQNNNMRRSATRGETVSTFIGYSTFCHGDSIIQENGAAVEQVVSLKSHFISPFLLWENVEEYWNWETEVYNNPDIEDKTNVLRKLRRANYFMGVCDKAIMSCTENNIDVLNPAGIVPMIEIASTTSTTCKMSNEGLPPSAFAVDKTGKYVLIGYPSGALRRVVINYNPVDYPAEAKMIDDGSGGTRMQTFEEYILGQGIVSSTGLPAEAFAWNEEIVYGMNPISGALPWGTQYITGINFDPNDNNRAILSVGGFNAGSEKVFYCQNATSPVQTWQPLFGLPAGMPVYDVILSANDFNFVTEYAYAATELGVWGYNFDTNSWTEENVGIGRVRTYRIRQELLKNAGCMAVYIGTHGRGIHRSVNLIDAFCDTDLTITQPGDATGIPQTETSASLIVNIYPNPVTDNSKVDFELTYNSPVNINILSIDGRMQRSESLGNLSAGRHHFNINASDLAAGNYIVNVVTEQEIVNSKFTVGK